MTTIPPDEKLVDLPKEELQQLQRQLRIDRINAAANNKWNLHQRIGEALLKVTQLLEEMFETNGYHNINDDKPEQL
jgi:hypothetical protein